MLQVRRSVGLLVGFALLGLSGCETTTTNQYEATVQTTLTWQVKYYENAKDDTTPRVEKFASTSLVSQNGVKSEAAVVGPDEKGLWWPALPPRPTIEQIEDRKKVGEVFEEPDLLRTAEYQISYVQGSQEMTLPTNYQVYRQVARAYPQQKPLKLTFGVNNGSVEKAEPQ